MAEQASLLREHGHRVEVLERSSAGLDRARRASSRGACAAARRARARARRSRSWCAERRAGRPCAQPAPAVRLARARGGARGGRPDGAAAAPLPPRVRDRRRVPRRRRVHTAARAEHAGRACGCAAAAGSPRRRLRRGLALASSRAILTADGSLHRPQRGDPDASSARSGCRCERTDVSPPAARASVQERLARRSAGRYALCVGRLVPEKGFDIAVAACRAAGMPLKIAGRGPEEARLRRLCGRRRRASCSASSTTRELERVRGGAAVAAGAVALRGAEFLWRCSRRWPAACRARRRSWAALPELAGAQCEPAARRRLCVGAVARRAVGPAAGASPPG